MTMLQHGVIESGGYNIDRSLRFRSSASAYLSRTPASASNRKTWTYSAWVKRGSLTTSSNLLDVNASGTVYFYVGFHSDNTFFMYEAVSGTDYGYFSTAVFRDPSAWYHVIISVDTTQATAANRVKLFVNGVQQTLTATYGDFPQNYDTLVDSTTVHKIGKNSDANAYLDGYLAEVNFIDGQALTPSSFGETSTETGVWVPKKYTGTYGTNGFYLPFSDNTSATTLAYDKSGNGNNWTANNISTTAGATYDSMTDVPTLTSATAANYCVLSPIAYGAASTRTSTSNGNLSFSDATSTNTSVIGTIAPTTGKWYFELTSSNTGVYAVGLFDQISKNESFYRNNGYYSSSFGGGGTSGYSSWTTGDVIGVAWDADAGKIWYAKNNTWQSGSPSAGTSPTNTFTANTGLTCSIDTDNSAGTKSGSFNFGQRPFSYTPPIGYKALNTFNLPDPTIKKPNQYMDATTWTGNGATSRSFTGLNFQPDFVWGKRRDATGANRLFDSVRGVGKQLYSNYTNAEDTNDSDGYVSAFNSDGWSITGSTAVNWNTNTGTYVAWNWKKGATPGFDIVTYTGNGTSQNISHSLGVAPAMIIAKGRATGGYGWGVWHKTFGANQYLGLNTTSAVGTSTSIWNNTSPTSTVFSVGADNWTNTNGNTYVAYLFAEIAGFSKFGSYTGNGSADGPFVFTGFQPKYVMIKRSDGVEQWYINDAVRDPYNVTGKSLRAQSSGAEATTGGSDSATWDINSNGFKLRDSGAGTNANGGTYIFAAFAENPFKYSLAR